MKLFVVWSSPLLCYLIHLRPKYIPILIVFSCQLYSVNIENCGITVAYLVFDVRITKWNLEQQSLPLCLFRIYYKSTCKWLLKDVEYAYV
jgi:hypothetical protein